LPNNVRWIGHVGIGDHNVVNCSARMVLNINRESMAEVGFSPPTRVFEAAGSGACVITDSWAGIEQFFEPEHEILIANSADDIVRHLRKLDREQSRRIGSTMRERALCDHTYQKRVEEVDRILRSEEAAIRRTEVTAWRWLS